MDDDNKFPWWRLAVITSVAAFAVFSLYIYGIDETGLLWRSTKLTENSTVFEYSKATSAAQDNFNAQLCFSFPCTAEGDFICGYSSYESPGFLGYSIFHTMELMSCFDAVLATAQSDVELGNIATICNRNLLIFAPAEFASSEILTPINRDDHRPASKEKCNALGLSWGEMRLAPQHIEILRQAGVQTDKSKLGFENRMLADFDDFQK